MARGFGGAGRVLALMFFIAIVSAVISAAIIVGVMVGVQDTGTPLIGSDRWFLFYMVPVILFSAIITVMMFTYLAQEKIKWVY